MPDLVILGLEQSHRGLTAAIAQTFYEAASVCLARHHGTPIDFGLEVRTPLTRSDVTISWEAPDRQMVRAWGNTNDATEAGSCALCIAAVFQARGLQVVARAETGTGADYFLAPLDQDPDDLEQCIRLEISGVDSGDAPTVYGRLDAKLAQAARGNIDTPAIAAVTGFRSRLIVLADMR